MCFRFWRRQTNRQLLIEIKGTQEKIIMDLTGLQTAVSSLASDTTKAIADVNTKLAALVANQQNPADADTIASAVAALGTVDTAIQGLDAAVNPPAAPTA